MPSYDVRCRSCGDTFEIRRPMARADEPVRCPAGHDDTVRLLPTVAMTGRASTAGPRSGARPSEGGGGVPSGGGGGCCGGSCGCG